MTHTKCKAHTYRDFLALDLAQLVLRLPVELVAEVPSALLVQGVLLRHARRWALELGARRRRGGHAYKQCDNGEEELHGAARLDTVNTEAPSFPSLIRP